MQAFDRFMSRYGFWFLFIGLVIGVLFIRGSFGSPISVDTRTAQGTPSVSEIQRQAVDPQMTRIALPTRQPDIYMKDPNTGKPIPMTRIALPGY